MNPNRDECTIRLPLQSQSTRARMAVVINSCPSQHPEISWSRMHASGNQSQPLHQVAGKMPPMHNHDLVVKCYAHFAVVHRNDPIPHGLRVTEEEASVYRWNNHALKSSTEKAKTGWRHAYSFHHTFTNTSANTNSSSSSFSSSSSSSTTPSMQPPTSRTPNYATL